jgi:hypothetical protein
MRVEVDERKEANNGLVPYFRRHPGHLAWGYIDRVDLLVLVAMKKTSPCETNPRIPEVEENLTSSGLSAICGRLVSLTK